MAFFHHSLKSSPSPPSPQTSILAAQQFSSMETPDLLLHIRINKGFLYAAISLLFCSLLAYNTTTVFWTRVPVISAEKPPPDYVAVVKSRKLIETAAYFPLLRKNRNLAVSTNGTGDFETRVTDFFGMNSSCDFRFFMTWISPAESFGDREMFALRSLFKAHRNGCLVIVSKSLDSETGNQILKPVLDKGLKLAAIAPDFNYLLQGTPGELWYNQLMQGNLSSGEVPLGQNLSNLLRLALLYRFGGIYLDTDVIILKSFVGLRNSIGAQTIDLESGNWSRLNNAVMVFDKSHPLLYKFIQEFALTFDGNKWGHNGPYLVSRVVSRLNGQSGFDFTVLPPLAFYPVNWSKIGSLFEGPKSLNHFKWLQAKMKQIHSHCFAVHLWNKQSRGFLVENGSIIQHIMSNSDFLNS